MRRWRGRALRAPATRPQAPPDPRHRGGEAIGLVADLLGVLRFALAGAFPLALAEGGWTALVVFAVAAATDYVDGPLARRSGRTTTYGALLDGAADVVFVLVGTAAGAASGRLSWVVPLSIACSASVYLVASVRRSRSRGAPARAYTRLGHAAGVCNYVLVGLIAGSTALPTPAWPMLLAAAGTLVVALNLGAVAMRLRPGRGADASHV